MDYLHRGQSHLPDAIWREIDKASAEAARDRLNRPAVSRTARAVRRRPHAVGDHGPTLHLHAVLGKADGSVVGGHLIEAYVRPTLEVILIQPPSYLRKRKDPETGLALIDVA
jgi:Plants and Prokaryotes Conserved (PCC) domain